MLICQILWIFEILNVSHGLILFMNSQTDDNLLPYIWTLIDRFVGFSIHQVLLFYVPTS